MTSNIKFDDGERTRQVLGGRREIDGLDIVFDQHKGGKCRQI